ncbi:hypothetical protein BT63DRAFT_376659 [Microthyrium microscopicum]|uniref:alpha-galactosidase n=1 Tax=Microthyrium microscopicum TaxID=703497 RepID=A0A6A6U3R4_9PEZI|nr:hypothetical protein BT63DRAFT_376659 [Microthyrium microscopicum]
MASSNTTLISQSSTISTVTTKSTSTGSTLSTTSSTSKPTLHLTGSGSGFSTSSSTLHLAPAPTSTKTYSSSSSSSSSHASSNLPSTSKSHTSSASSSSTTFTPTTSTTKSQPNLPKVPQQSGSSWTTARPSATPTPFSGVSGWDKARTNSFQIILSGVPDLKANAKSVTPDVDVYDVDLFMIDKNTIQTLKSLNKTVICYFSGGTYEPGRPDSFLFPSIDLGNRLLEWPSEKWIRLGSANIRRLIADRIKLAHDKGCDAIDPDNIDGYQARGAGGLNLRRSDAVSFMRFISESAAKYNMATGLKNGMDLISSLGPYVHFAVNEQCADKRECEQYRTFKKPVFHIEYPRLAGNRLLSSGLSLTQRAPYCGSETDRQLAGFFHTAIKNKALDGAVQYCDGKFWKTPTKETQGGRSRSGYVVSAGEPEDDVGEGQENFKAWQHDPKNIAAQAELAKQDGYPYPPGKGSQELIPDKDLMKDYERAADEE